MDSLVSLSEVAKRYQSGGQPELGTGTFRQAWTQSVTRTRWLAAKLGFVGLAGMAAAGLLSLLATWWSSPLDRVEMGPFATFDQRDLVPIGYAALALGVTAGMLIRRTPPAMATTLAVFVAVRVVLKEWARPYLIAPLRIARTNTTWTGRPPTGLPPKGIDIAGVDRCPNIKPPYHGQNADALIQRCVAQLRIRDVLTYQPASRHWPSSGTSWPSTWVSPSSWPGAASGGSDDGRPEASRLGAVVRIH